MELKKKLEILADAAKYDASCASSGTETRTSIGGNGIARQQAWVYAIATRLMDAAFRS
jgi:predicted DNA-binding helix-hairpin-helix protein